MRQRELFRQALGLTPPWRVWDVSFDPEAGRLELRLDFAKGARFPCPECERADCPAYDAAAKRWRHLDFFQHETHLVARVPRVECPACGVKQVEVPWDRKNSGFTLLMEAYLQEFWEQPPELAEAFLKRWYYWATHSQLTPIVRVAKTIKEHWDGVLRWFQTPVDNGILEGLNSLIQAAKAKARGYRTSRNLIVMAYLIAGRLDFQLPNATHTN